MSETGWLEKRKFRRFDMKLPLEITRAGTRRISRAGETRNLSSGGVFFTVQSRMEIGEPIEYFITLPSVEESGADVRLLCKGKVLRQEPPPRNGAANSASSVAIAATLERYEFIRTDGGMKSA